LFKGYLAFYYGWTDKEISDLPIHKAREYFDAMEVITARESLEKLSVSDYGNSKKSGRDKIFKHFSKRANPIHMQKQMSFEDFAKAMKNG